MARVPYRRGTPTILKLIAALIRLLSAFRDVVDAFYTPEQMAKWDALHSAAVDFEETVPNYDAGTIVEL